MADGVKTGDGKVHLSTRVDAGLKYRLGLFALTEGLRLNEALTLLLNQALPPAESVTARKSEAAA